jgi:hypothetical protein
MPRSAAEHVQRSGPARNLPQSIIETSTSCNAEKSLKYKQIWGCVCVCVAYKTGYVPLCTEVKVERHGGTVAIVDFDDVQRHLPNVTVPVCSCCDEPYLWSETIPESDCRKKASCKKLVSCSPN